MGGDSNTKYRWPFKGSPFKVEGAMRNTLLLGYFILLLLIVAIGYWSRDNLDRLEDDIAAIHQTSTEHLKLVLKLSEIIGQMAPEARTVMGNTEGFLMRIPAQQRLKQLRREMDEHIAHGRKTRLAETEQWKNFEAAFNEYWATLTAPDSIPQSDASDDDLLLWYDERNELGNAILALEQYTYQERETEQAHWKELNVRARRKIALATCAALVLGFIVASLMLYEIRRVLKRMEAAYRESSESRDYLQSLLDSLVSGVVVIGRDGKAETINRSFGKAVTPGGKALVGQSYEALFKDKPSLIESISKHLNDLTEPTRYYGRVELGQRRLFDVFASPLIIAEEQQGLILVFVDITENERAQAELRRNRALSAVGQMTAQIAHEIKNPLGSIRFAAELLKRRGTPSEEDKEMVQVIERSVDHLAAIVSELSEFGRPKELNRTEINLNELLDGIIPMVADRLTRKGIIIEKNFAPQLPTSRYDGTELRKLFLNLIINAIDASDEGGKVKVSTHLNGGREVFIDVEDNGSGMDQETLRRLFEPFYTTKQNGTGLGMAIAKKIAELHMGDLSVVSRKGEGTRVTVRLPLE